MAAAALVTEQEALVTAAEAEETTNIAEIDRIELEDGLVAEEAENVTEETAQAALLVTDEAAHKAAAAVEITAEKESEDAAIAAETAKIGRIRDKLAERIIEKKNALARAKEIVIDKTAQLTQVQTMRSTTQGSSDATV